MSRRSGPASGPPSIDARNQPVSLWVGSPGRSRVPLVITAGGAVEPRRPDQAISRGRSRWLTLVLFSALGVVEAVGGGMRFEPVLIGIALLMTATLGALVVSLSILALNGVYVP